MQFMYEYRIVICEPEFIDGSGGLRLSMLHRGDCMNAPDVVFEKLGIEFMTLNEVAFRVFGIEIYWYALFIALGFIGGLAIASIIAKKTGQDPDIYSDFMVYCLIAAIVGARLYYVALEWDSYKGDLTKIFAVRQGGLAIYGGIIACVITLWLFTRIKKLSFWIMCDTAVAGLAFGQMVGRMGNFVNKEAFGGYTDNLFAMSIKASEAKYIPAELMNNMTEIAGTSYIQVHPTFLYEALWSLATIGLILMWFRVKRFKGEVFFIYMLSYGIGRFWIEGLRTDQLIIGSTGLPISQVVAAVSAVVALVVILLGRRRYHHSNM